MTFDVTRATSPIKIDGVLDEGAWQTAAVVPLPYEWAPGDNVPPPVETRCLVTYDAKYLYIAFRAHDPKPGEIRAHLMDRDDTDTLIQDDHVGVMIDTFNDERRAFQFRINPLGVQADAIFSEQDGVEDFSWDMIWNAVGRITPDGFIVEMALPLKQLRFQPGEGRQTWGFEAFRSWPRNVRHRISSQRRDRNIACLLCQENKIAGLEGLAQGRNVEFDPTATFSRTDTRESPTDSSLANGDPNADAGLTARWSVTSSMTLNGAINPDFSQVEADVAQLDVNQRFALFYPEKRPFFLEGIDYFTTPIQAVFTRTVADPYFGAKLTGKQGGNAMGLFVTRDRINNLLLPANEGSSNASLDDDVTTVVGRYRRDLGSSSTIGGLYAGREGAGYHNRQYGADLFWRPSATDALRVQYIRTDTEYPKEIVADYGQPEGAFGGNGTWIDYQHTTRKWAAFGSYEAYDSGFRSDTGFVPRVDYRAFSGQGQRRWDRGAGAWFNTIDVGVRGWRMMDDAWTMTDQTVAAFVNYTGPFQTQVQFNMPHDEVVYQGVRYQYYRPNFYAGVKPSGRSSIQFTGRFGDGVDYANNRKATGVVQLGPIVEYRPVTQVSMQLSYNLDQLSVDGSRLYRANLAQFKLMYYLGVRTFLRAILQYTDISRDVNAYAFPVEHRTRRLFSQYLFSYKLNPQTMLFVGYSDNSASTASVDLQQTDRTFFVKLGYAWAF
ncbi:MAG: DUF5916 domain-containing protein [Acidobacteria bacterium]|nr:DUF5916 domain-containing protein [Acidobacteriota bacterium]